MKILIVTPTLGTSRWLPETVRSVAAHAGAVHHVLVAPAAAVPSLAECFPEVDVVPDCPGGMYAALNLGLAHATEWDAFTYINDDDLLLPGFAAVTRAIAGRTKTPLITYGRVRLIDAAGRRLGAVPVSPGPRLLRALYAQGIEPIYQQGTLFTRSAWEILGGFDASLRYCGDSEILARACVKGIPFFRATGAEVAAFRLRAGQLTKNRAESLAERDRVDCRLALRVHGSILGQSLAKWTYRVANLPVYAERIARHGFVTMNELIERTP